VRQDVDRGLDQGGGPHVGIGDLPDVRLWRVGGWRPINRGGRGRLERYNANSYSIYSFKCYANP
jgi:hypothetical protein